MNETPWLSKTEFAYRRVRAAIENGEHGPGDKLSINQLSQELKISPTPVREALRMLQAHGLVTHEPHMGMVVASYSPEQASEIIDLRLLLEPHAVKLAIDRIDDDIIARLESIHAEMQEELGEATYGGNLANLNADFHRELYEAAESPVLKGFIADLWRRVPLQVMWYDRRVHDSVQQHAKLLDAVRAKDGDEAAKIMREHIKWGATTTPAQVKPIWDPAVVPED